MHAGKPLKQSLAISYSIKRQNKKKMAKGGMVNESAASEKRPMPEERDKDSKMISQNSSKKALVNADWDQNPMIKKPKTQPIKHPSFAQSPVFRVKLRDQEDHLESKEAPASPKEQPEQDYNEIGPDRQGPKVRDMQDEHSTHRKPYADGGEIKSSNKTQQHQSNDLNKAIHKAKAEKREKFKEDEEDSFDAKPSVRMGAKRANYAKGGQIAKPKGMDLDAAKQHKINMNRLRDANNDQEKARAQNIVNEHVKKYLAKGGEVNWSDPKEAAEEMANRRSQQSAVVYQSKGDIKTAKEMLKKKKSHLAEGGEVESSDYSHKENKYEDDLTDLPPSEDEAEMYADTHDEEGQDRQGPAVPDMEHEHSNGRKPYAMGGEISPEDEIEEERHNSIAAAIMAKRDRMHAMIDSGAMDMDNAVHMAEGGEINGMDSIYPSKSSQVELKRNAEEDANMEDQSSYDALRKENYSESEGLSKLDSPYDSNLHGDQREMDEENRHDMISKIRSKMNFKRQFSK